MVAKLLLFPPLLAAACVIAGLYGALHNQISYTVSPAYFHDFKFHQFRIPESLHGRAGAALVGWYASWWMGLLIGVPLLMIGLILPGWRSYLNHSLRAFGVVAVTTLATGLGALALAYVSITGPDTPHLGGVADPAFERAGTMHNFSYLGGFLGVITGAVYLAWTRLRAGAGSREQAGPPVGVEGPG